MGLSLGWAFSWVVFLVLAVLSYASVASLESARWLYFVGGGGLAGCPPVGMGVMWHVSHHLAGQPRLSAWQMLRVSRVRGESGKPLEAYIQEQYEEPLLQSIGQSTSSWQPRFKGWRNKVHLYQDGAAKPAFKNMDLGKGRFCGHFRNLSPSHQCFGLEGLLIPESG